MKLVYNSSVSARIDKYLASLAVPELYSRTIVEKIINDSRVKVNGNCVRKNYLLHENDSIEIELPAAKQYELIPEDIPLDIVYEDEFLAVINKQAGINVHPTPGNYTGTIVNALLNYYGEKLADGLDKTRPGIVHRLDKNTSGLMIIAKDNKTLFQLNKLFAQRMIVKRYKAILVGIPNENSGTISTNIARSSKDRTKMTVKPSGKEAVTSYTVEKCFTYFSLVDILLKTGRTHQIRVHFNHINCPVFGDETYGVNKLKNLLPQNQVKRVSLYLQRNLKRQALHSYRLEFIHPVTERELCVETVLPEDMEGCLRWLETNY